jgi:hypothetical protein
VHHDEIKFLLPALALVPGAKRTSYSSHTSSAYSKSFHSISVARLKRPAGTADWWEHASHQGIHAHGVEIGTLGSLRPDSTVLHRVLLSIGHEN